MKKTPREIVEGKADGVNINAAVQDAISKTSPPSDGFDFQTYDVASQKFIHGGITGALITQVTLHVYDGNIED